MDVQKLERLVTNLKMQANAFELYLEEQKTENKNCVEKIRTSLEASEQSQLSSKANTELNFEVRPIQLWKRDCLSYSVQWHSHLLMKTPLSCACITKLGNVLHSENKLQANKKYHLLCKQEATIKLLIDIKNTDLEAMEQCLQIIAQENPDVIQLIYKLNKQYQETGLDSLKCGYCKISSSLNIKHYSVYLWRHGILSDTLFELIATSGSDQKSQTGLWKALEAELKLYTTRDHIVKAVYETIDNFPETYANKQAQIKEWLNNSCSNFACACQMVYFNIARAIDNSNSECESETDTVVSDNQEKYGAKKNEPRKCRSKSRSTSGSRSKGLIYQNPKDQKPKCKPPVKQHNKGKEIKRSQSWTPDDAKRITVNRQKSSVINIHNTGQGSINVGNSTVKVGKRPLSDISTDTESCRSTSNDSESDTGNGIPTPQTPKLCETNKPPRPVGKYCKWVADYQPQYEMKTSRRRRTVSESAASAYDNKELTILKSLKVKEEDEIKVCKRETESEDHGRCCPVLRGNH